MKNFLFFVLLIIIIFAPALSEDNVLDSRYGIYGAFNFNFHSADFNKLRDIPNCCPQFENGSGTGLNIGALYEVPLSKQLLLGFRFGYMTLDGELTNTESTLVIVNRRLASGEFTHTMIGKFSNIGIEPYFSYQLFNDFFLGVGLRFGANLTATYNQKEEITKPASVGTFADSLGNDTYSRTRNVRSGDIPDAVSPINHLIFRANYDLPLNKDRSMLLSPEMAFYVSLNEFVKETSWKVGTLSLGLSIKYSPKSFQKKIEEFKEDIIIDTIHIASENVKSEEIVIGKQLKRTIVKETDGKIETTDFIKRTDTLLYPKTYELSGDIFLFGVDKDGQEIDNPLFKIEEFASNRYHPLLNYIFFDENSSNIPARYVRLNAQETDNFFIDSLYNETTIEVYFQLLNIIGKRLAENADAKLTIIGCNSDIGLEKGNSGLSLKRAEAVKSYLVDVWKINETRLEVKSRILPEKASFPVEEEDKASENRRVELYSDNFKVLEPVVIETITRTANPPVVRFKLTAKSDTGLEKWRIYATQTNMDKDENFEKVGSETLPEKVDWSLESFQKYMPRYAQPIIYSLDLTDRTGKNEKVEKSSSDMNIISIKQKRIQKIDDYEIENYSLILFDFDKADIEEGNKRVINFILSKIKASSQIEIKGYTDRTGDDAYNKRLSGRRAQAAKAALKRQDAISLGIGEDVLLYDNDLPEGRFYCRTVEVTIKTKVE